MDFVKKVGINQIEETSIIKEALKNVKFPALLRRCSLVNRGNGSKKSIDIIYRIIATIFLKKPLQSLWEAENSIAICLKSDLRKNCYYRFLKRSHFNWRKVIWMLAIRIIKPLRALSEVKKDVLILDDTPISKRGKKIELLSRQYDHSTDRYFNGFTHLFLGWSDGHTFIPLDVCVKVGKTILNTVTKKVDGRSNGGKRRKETRITKLEQGLSMLKRVYKSHLEVRAVVYDTWFAKPGFIKSVLEIGYHSVCHLAKNEKIWKVTYKEDSLSFKQLYRLLRNEKKFKKVQIANFKQKITSIIVQHKNGVSLKLVFCRLSKKNWVVYGSTDTALSDMEILECYVKRWGIESFFKNAKQLFYLGREGSTDFDVQIAMTSIRMIAYIFTAHLHRLNKDDRTLGSLFAKIANSFSHLNLDHTILNKIFDLILDTLDFPRHTLNDLKNVFLMVCDNFASKGSCLSLVTVKSPTLSA